jgi:hypothetical protein
MFGGDAHVAFVLAVGIIHDDYELAAAKVLDRREDVAQLGDGIRFVCHICRPSFHLRYRHRVQRASANGRPRRSSL